MMSTCTMCREETAAKYFQGLPVDTDMCIYCFAHYGPSTTELLRRQSVRDQECSTEILRLVRRAAELLNKMENKR